MYGLRVGTVKKAEHRRIDAFELWCWRRLLRVPWSARGYKQSILKEISPEYSLEGLMLKLQLQYLATWCEELTHLKDLDAGKDWGQEKGTTEHEMVGWHHWLDGHWFGWTPAAGDGQGGLACCGSWGCRESDTTERLDWTELIQLCQLWPLQHYEQQRKKQGIKKLIGHLKGSGINMVFSFQHTPNQVRLHELNTPTWECQPGARG